MEEIKVRTLHQVWIFQKDVSDIFNYKSPSGLLKRFREFSDKHPNFFLPHKPYLMQDSSLIQYDVFCFAFYYENRGLLEAGSRSIKFQDDIERLKEVYG